jgi:hypothetical protein
MRFFTAASLELEVDVAKGVNLVTPRSKSHNKLLCFKSEDIDLLLYKVLVYSFASEAAWQLK